MNRTQRPPGAASDRCAALTALLLLLLLLGCASVGCVEGKDRGGGTTRYDGGAAGKVPGAYKVLSGATFSMGSPATEPCREQKGYRETRHLVTLTRRFEIDALEVTQGAFEAVLGYNPAKFATGGALSPVEQVSWHEAAAYCNALSKVRGLTPCYRCAGSGVSTSCGADTAYATEGRIYRCPGYRLPTEAEWELAYRAGTTTAIYTGALPGCQTDAAAGAIAWYYANATSGTAGTRQGGLKKANAWGLHDMAGNVGEWTHDVLAVDLGAKAVTDPVTTPASAGADPTRRVLRGGGWLSDADALRAAFRSAQPATFQNHDIGFRCARTLEP